VYLQGSFFAERKDKEDMSRDSKSRNYTSMENVQTYKVRFHGCAATTYALCADLLGLKGDEVFRAMMGLSGGIGLVGSATCGAMVGAAAAISQALCSTRARFPDEQETEFIIHRAVSPVIDAFVQQYGGHTCHQVQLALHGKAFDLASDAAREEFNRLDKRCTEPILNAVNWACGCVENERRRESAS
jgi:Putative redox-active protein (C_GCAxxG_C_C)